MGLAEQDEQARGSLWQRAVHRTTKRYGRRTNSASEQLPSWLSPWTGSYQRMPSFARPLRTNDVRNVGQLAQIRARNRPRLRSS